MGEHAPKENLDTAWMIEPDATVRARYDVLFALLKSFLEGKPLPTVPPPAREKGPAEMGPAETGPKENAPPQLKESGPAEL